MSAKITKKLIREELTCEDCCHSEKQMDNISNDGKPILSKCKYKKYLTLLNWYKCNQFKQK